MRRKPCNLIVEGSITLIAQISREQTEAIRRTSLVLHLAATRRKYKGKVYEIRLLRRTYRDGGKVKNETVGNISHLPVEIIELVRRALKGEVFSDVHEDLEIMRSLPHWHVAAVLGMIRKLRL